jgi:uncharacterized membrane protein SpoIIM required for sporulation
MGWDEMQGAVLALLLAGLLAGAFALRIRWDYQLLRNLLRPLGYRQREADTITFWFLLVTMGVTLMLLLLKMLVVD